MMASTNLNQQLLNTFSCMLVTDESLVQRAKAIILDMYHLNDIQHFPGALPVSLMRKDLIHLRRSRYYVAEKTDGIRHLLLVMDNGPGSEQSLVLLVDRSWRMFYTNITFSVTMSKGSLFDGEMVLDKTPTDTMEWVYYVHDALFIAGNCVANDLYRQRLDRISNTLRWMSFPPASSSEQMFRMTTKRVYLLTKLPHVWRNIVPNLPHKCDGLILTPNELPHRGKKNRYLYKWKDPEDHTIDLRLDRPIPPNSLSDLSKAPTADGFGPPNIAYHLQTWDTHNYHDFCEIAMCKERWHAMGIDDPGNHRGIILECRWHPTHNLWVPEVWRKDKLVPNDHYTVRKTLETMMENLGIEELIHISETLRKR